MVNNNNNETIPGSYKTENNLNKVLINKITVR